MATTTITSDKLANGTLPPDWRKVRFGDVVRNVDTYERSPLENGIERYVGLDHLDPESLHIKRWGNVVDGTTFTRKFIPGQVLFGKRRAYQRKAAVAEFEGICSGDILVFEPANGELIPELLPFIVQSDGFFNHALGTSAGSLSPRTKWKDLADYEFALPPFDEQRRIAEILWAADQAVEQYIEVLNSANNLYNSLLTQLTTVGFKSTKDEAPPSYWTNSKVGELLEICQYGLSLPMLTEGRYPIFRMMNFENGVVVENDLKYINLSEAEYQTYRLEPGDLLFNRTNSADLVGKVGIYRLRGEHVFASYLIRLRVRKDRVFPDYLNYYLNSDLGQMRVRAFATPGVSQTNINAESLRRVVIPLPPLDEQTRIVDILREAEMSREVAAKKVETLRATRKQLIASLVR